MIAAMRPDIDNIDEYVRNTTARAFSVVASALGIPALLPFLKAVCQSKKSWQVSDCPPLTCAVPVLISVTLACCVSALQCADQHCHRLGCRHGIQASRSCSRLPSCWAAPSCHT